MPCIFTQSIMNRAWNASDTDILLKYIREGKSVEYISKKQNRYIHSIRSKLKSIAAELYLKNGMPYDQIYSATGISKEAIIIAKPPVSDEKLEDFPEEYICIEITRPPSPVSPVKIITPKEEFEYKTICDHLISTFKICASIANQIAEINHRISYREELPRS